MNPYDPSVPSPRPSHEAAPATAGVPGVLRAAAIASLGAGAIHATCVGSHGGEKTLAVVFALTAAAQIGWGAVALVRSGWWVSLAGAAVNATAFGGWAVAMTAGISFIPGLENAQTPGFADRMAAALAAVAILGSLLALARRAPWVARPHPALVGVAGIAALSLAVPGMVSASAHRHDPGHDMDGMAGMDHGRDGDMGGMDHGHVTATPPKPYTATLPVDLGGVPGVTAKQQKAAEDLVTRTIEKLPQFADYQKAQDAGWHSIRDAFGPGQFEHLVNWPLIEDGKILDPDLPESLVYQVQPDGSRKLVAAMYMLSRKVPLDEVPDIGGPLVQWHKHNNLCYTGPENEWRVAGVADPGTPCPPGTFRFENPEPMVHVWIVPTKCGPFAALEGIAGGQIRDGETRLCDTAHGDPGAPA